MWVYHSNQLDWHRIFQLPSLITAKSNWCRLQEKWEVYPVQQGWDKELHITPSNIAKQRFIKIPQLQRNETQSLESTAGEGSILLKAVWNKRSAVQHQERENSFKCGKTVSFPESRLIFFSETNAHPRPKFSRFLPAGWVLFPCSGKPWGLAELGGKQSPHKTHRQTTISPGSVE